MCEWLPGVSGFWPEGLPKAGTLSPGGARVTELKQEDTQTQDPAQVGVGQAGSSPALQYLLFQGGQGS